MTRRTRRSGGTPTRALALTLVLLLAGCGGSSDNEGGGGATTSTPATPTTTATTVTTTGPGATASATTTSNNPFPVQASGSGTATLTIAGETLQFDSFTCFTGDAAVDATGDDDTFFAALGQTETADGTSTVAVSAIESPFGPNYTIFFSPTSDANDAWQRVGGDAATIDGGMVSGEGDFERIVGGERTGEMDPGAFAGDCG